MAPGTVAEFDCLATDTEARVLDYIRQELEALYLGAEDQGPGSELTDMLP
jgi:hypothetical protein